MEAPFESIAIVGFGLIGGSFGKALRARYPQIQLTAIDHAAVLETPEAQEITGSLVDATDTASVDAVLRSCELTVLAMPVGAIKQLLPRVLTLSNAVSDCGSTKREIVELARSCANSKHFVPGHPMAGRPQGGLASADAELFRDRNWLLCPGVAAEDLQQRVAALIRSLGARPVDIQPEDHDRAVALTSHLPQLMASLLAQMADSPGVGVAAGPGFASATRVAGGAESMWRDIFSSNSEQISAVAGLLGARLSGLAASLRHGDAEPCVQVLKEARRVRKTPS